MVNTSVQEGGAPKQHTQYGVGGATYRAEAFAAMKKGAKPSHTQILWKYPVFVAGERGSFWLYAYLDERAEVVQCASSALVGRGEFNAGIL